MPHLSSLADSHNRLTRKGVEHPTAPGGWKRANMTTMRSLNRDYCTAASIDHGPQGGPSGIRIPGLCMPSRSGHIRPCSLARRVRAEGVGVALTSPGAIEANFFDAGHGTPERATMTNASLQLSIVWALKQPSSVDATHPARRFPHHAPSTATSACPPRHAVDLARSRVAKRA